MSDYEQYADVTFEQVGDSFQVASMHPDLRLHGIGRSAAVFRLKEKNRVIKVFFPGYEQSQPKRQRSMKNLRDSLTFRSAMSPDRHIS